MAVIFDEQAGKRTRRCNGCTLCCKLVPTAELNKAAGERCKYQRAGKGCSIYAARPMSCMLWSCRWLVEDDTADMSRPDRVGYVIDVMPDFVVLTVDGVRTEMPCVQVWCDPRFPDAWRDPQLRRFMERRADQDGMATLIRFNNERGIVIFPPSISADRQWHEVDPTSWREKQHSAHEVARVLAGGDSGAVVHAEVDVDPATGGLTLAIKK